MTSIEFNAEKIGIKEVPAAAELASFKRTDRLRRILNAGSGPFKVVIGDINAVKISVNGKPYNLRAHARGKVARFTLDPSRL